MDKATEIQNAITQAMVAFSPFRDRQPGVLIGISRDDAHLIAESVFNTLWRGGYLKATDLSPPERQVRITLAITEAIGHVGEAPGNYQPGEWCEMTPAPDLGEVVDAIYGNLAYREYLTKETSRPAFDD